MQVDDPDGLYDTLGVAPSASREEIRRAYRKLAKQTHPDTAPEESVVSFQQISLAYKILSDQRTRLLYDRTGLHPDSEEDKQPKLHPVTCSCCGRVTAQPREVTYVRMYGVLLTSIKREVTALYCARCARDEGLRSSVLTSLFGWWAVPFGPYNTIRAVYGNATASRHDPVADAGYLWQNSQAFLQQGKLRLGYALAKRVTTADDPELAVKARRLVRKLEMKGISAGKAKLSAPWKTRPSVALSHFLILCVVPATIAGLVVLQPWDQRLSVLASHGEGVASISTGAGLSEAVALRLSCPHKPVNGEILYRVVSNKAAAHQLQVNNATGTAAVVKVRGAFSRRLISAIFVAPNSSATLDKVPDGYFNFQYAFGADLARNCRTFIDTISTWQLPETANFRSMDAGLPLSPQHIALSLENAPSATKKIMKIGLDVFNAN